MKQHSELVGQLNHVGEPDPGQNLHLQPAF
jgi:hypothetical protein